MNKLNLLVNYSLEIPENDDFWIIIELFDKIDLNSYIKIKNYDGETRGRKGYSSRDLLAAILFASMKNHTSLRDMESFFKYDIRCRYILDSNSPSHVTIGNFINNNLIENIESIMVDLILAIKDFGISIDLNTVYIDGSKIEAASNKYTWVWKNACLKFRDKMFIKISKRIPDLQANILDNYGLEIEVKEEYTIDDLENLISFFETKKNELDLVYVYSQGKRKTVFQRYHDEFLGYLERLKTYSKKIAICGSSRNSYSKTDQDATFMRIKVDYMGNDSLLPAYNLQVAVSNCFIVHMDTYQFASDSSTFIPFMKSFKENYGFYPKYPVGDAGYGSMTNLCFLEDNNIEKYIKFPMYKNHTKNKKYINDKFAVRNMKIDEFGNFICPNNKLLKFWKTKKIEGNQFERTTEMYKCDDCKSCPMRKECMKSKAEYYENKVVTLNKEMTKFHDEVIKNLASDRGIKCRVNRSIQAEGAFGDIKSNYGFDRVKRKSLKSVKFETFLTCIGHNLRRFINILNDENQDETTSFTDNLPKLIDNSFFNTSNISIQL